MEEEGSWKLEARSRETEVNPATEPFDKSSGATCRSEPVEVSHYGFIFKCQDRCISMTLLNEGSQ